jgi:formylglycine-generating enzyme required for sulfatase activity
MKRHWAVVLLVGVLGAYAPLAHSYLASGDIHLSAGLLLSSGDGQVVPLCAEDLVVDMMADRRWKLEARPEPASGSSDQSADKFKWSCSPAPEKVATEVSPETGDCGSPEFLIDVEAVINHQMEDERSATVSVSVKRTGPGCPGEKSGRSVEPLLSRKVLFPDDAEILIPFKVTDHQEATSRGDVFFVRLRSLLQPAARQSNLGRIDIYANAPGATVLLDGGVVGTVPESGEFTVNFVRPGLREVSLRSDSEGARDWFVRVVPGRTHLLDFPATRARARQANLSLDPMENNEEGYKEFRRRRDGAVMIEVPEGEFLMGNKRTERSPYEHLVYLSGFLIDRTAVTWAQYRKFVAGTGIPMPPHDPYWGIHDDHPAVYVTWEEARSYCEWTGGRLPTEAEREKAARGTDARLYPWGEEEPSTDRAVFRRTWANEATDPVGIRPLGASPYGGQDMGGNVWEWCLDWYSDEYLEDSPYRDPPGPESGRAHVVRGGSWDSRPDVTSASCRNWGYPGYREGDFGFRCARNAPAE